MNLIQYTILIQNKYIPTSRLNKHLHSSGWQTVGDPCELGLRRAFCGSLRKHTYAPYSNQCLCQTRPHKLTQETSVRPLIGWRRALRMELPPPSLMCRVCLCVYAYGRARTVCACEREIRLHSLLVGAACADAFISHASALFNTHIHTTHEPTHTNTTCTNTCEQKFKNQKSSGDVLCGGRQYVPPHKASDMCTRTCALWLRRCAGV